MKEKRKVDYRPVLVELHRAQLEELDRVKRSSGATRVDLIREAIALYLGRYALAEKGDGDVKVA